MPFDATTKPDTETAALLRKAKALIDTPEKWCQGTCARDARGKAVLLGSATAVAHCSFGAVWALSANTQQAASLLRRVGAEMGYGGEVVLNDSTDHPTVMRMFDRAIDLAREKG